jgi:hypothetical protein
MEKLKYNTPYPKADLIRVPSGSRLQVVVNSEIRIGRLKEVKDGNMILMNGFAITTIELASIRSFCLIREDRK